MAVTPKIMYTNWPSGTTLGTAYTVPANTKAIVKQIIITNTSSSAAICNGVHIVDNSASATDFNKIITELSFAPHETRIWDLSLMLDTAGMTIQVQQNSASALTFHIYGVEIT